MPGTTLIRGWGAREYRVTVTSDGLNELDGQRYKSLSAVAPARPPPRHLKSERGSNWSASPSCGRICKTWQVKFNVCIGTAMAEPDGDILTLDEVAAYLKAGKRTIYRLAASGEIPAFKLGGTWRFSRSDIESWIKQQSAGKPERAASKASNKGDRK
jgi:excisionase family DNA binding protein